MERLLISGLFSYLEAFFDRPLVELVESLPLHASITTALLTRAGPVGALLETAIRLESESWEEIPWPRLELIGIQVEDVRAADRRARQAVRELQANAAP